MLNLHIISQTGGSIGEITNSLIPHFKKHFKVTQEFKFEKPEIPESLDILLMHFVNPNYVQSRVFEYFKLKVLIQPIDGTQIKPEYSELMNKFDLIFTPSTSNKKILIQNGVAAEKIKVVPNFIRKSDIFTHIEDETFTFYTELFLQERKNLNAIIDFYKTEFDTENVKLIVKSNMDQHALKKFKRDVKNNYSTKSEVEFINGYYLPNALHDLWKKVDCYINLSGIEGFGIPLLRFTLNGIPVVAIDNPNAGYQDFINKDYLIKDFQFRKKQDLELYSENSTFAIPNKESSMKVLRRVFEESSIDRNSLDLSLYNKYNINSVKKQYIDEIFSKYREKNTSTESLRLDSNIKIRYISPYGTSGYAIAGKEYIRALNKNHSVSWTPIHFGDVYTVDEKKDLVDLIQVNNNPNVQIIHSTPEWWKDYKKDDMLNIGYTVWETDKLHESWPGMINQMDGVMVPSHWNKDILLESGVNIPIFVVPHIAPNIEIKTKRPNNNYSFYSIGQWTERKGTEATLRAYLEEFTEDDNVQLTLKTFLNSYTSDEMALCQRKVNDIMSEYDNPPEVKLISHELFYDEIINLHQTHHCYISACRAEGWGLGAFEAAQHKNPVIMTGFGGQTEFLNEHSNLLVGYHLVPVKGMDHIPWYTEDQNWADPNMFSFKSKMRRAYENWYQDYDYKITERFSSDIISQKIIEAIKRLRS